MSSVRRCGDLFDRREAGGVRERALTPTWPSMSSARDAGRGVVAVIGPELPLATT